MIHINIVEIRLPAFSGFQLHRAWGLGWTARGQSEPTMRRRTSLLRYSHRETDLATAPTTTRNGCAPGAIHGLRIICDGAATDRFNFLIGDGSCDSANKTNNAEGLCASGVGRCCHRSIWTARYRPAHIDHRPTRFFDRKRVSCDGDNTDDVECLCIRGV